jgi:homoserine dehydrogenase
MGAGVVQALYDRGVAGLRLARVADTDLETPRPLTLPAELLTKDWRDIVNDPSIDIVVELVGGIDPALEIQTQALRSGKDVVTANKKLLANSGQEIFALASDLGRRVGFRASFVGCHALIHEFQQAGVAAKKYRRIHAILNGTSNYILSTMTREGKAFADALKEAQDRGLAEADPSDDVDGIDTANKIRILLGLITNTYRTVPQFPVEGVRDVSVQDIQYALELGYSIKLVGVIELADRAFAEEGFTEGASAKRAFNVAVHPALVPRASLLGSLEGAYNGTELEDEFGVISGLVAPGAGVYPTTDAVVKDLLDIAEGRSLPMPSSNEELPLGASEDALRRYYIRFSVVDQAGVLAQIGDIFWKHDISIAAVIQKEAVSKDFVPLVLTTHLAREGNVQAALKQVDRLEVIRAATRAIRVLDAGA